MSRLICLAALFMTVMLAATSVYAGNNNDSNPATDSVCDVLKEDGVTKGLYGLCVAYCEAGSANSSVLSNYERRATEDDPPMPCLETVVDCPCWGIDELAGASEIADSNLCFSTDDTLLAIYGSSNEVVFGAGNLESDGVDRCAYQNQTTVPITFITSTTDSSAENNQTAECRAGIQALIDDPEQGFPECF